MRASKVLAWTLVIAMGIGVLWVIIGATMEFGWMVPTLLVGLPVAGIILSWAVVTVVNGKGP
jgi:hypothetical protein